jgi:hypothetical protein
MKAKPESSEYKAFEGVLSKVLSVSKAELTSRLENEKREKQISKSASHASAVPTKPS